MSKTREKASYLIIYAWPFDRIIFPATFEEPSFDRIIKLSKFGRCIS